MSTYYSSLDSSDLEAGNHTATNLQQSITLLKITPYRFPGLNLPFRLDCLRAHGS